MKIEWDTAHFDKIAEAVKLGICDGITTNPSLMSKENLKGDDMIYNHYMEIAKLIKGDVSIEVLADTYDEIIKEAQDIMSIHSNVVVKIPCTKDGLVTVFTRR